MTTSNIHDVARLAKVSTMTVSRFFNAPEKLSEKTRERVRKAISAANYVPNAAARSLILGRTDTIALVLSDITNPFFTTLVRGAEDRAQQNNISLIICNTDETLEKEQRYIEILVKRRIDGVILSPTHTKAEHLRELVNRKIPTVLLDRHRSELPFDVVRGDSKKAAFELTEHLIEQRYRKIAFVGGPRDNFALADRVSGYQRALRIHRLKERILLGAFTEASGLELTRKILAETRQPMPDAIIAANNHVALGVIEALKERHLKIPGVIGLAAFEEVETPSWRPFFFTVTVQPAYELGWKAADQLIQRASEPDAPPRQIVLPFTLHRRASTGG